jgi:hypothetical protein
LLKTLLWLGNVNLDSLACSLHPYPFLLIFSQVNKSFVGIDGRVAQQD